MTTAHKGLEEKNPVCGQVLLLWCVMCNVTMCKAKREDYTRKCSEAGSLKELVQQKRSLHSQSHTRGLHATFVYFVSTEPQNFFPYRFLKSISSGSNSQCVQAVRPRVGHQTAASCNERCVVIIIIVSNGSFSTAPDNDLLLSSVTSVDEEAERRQTRHRASADEWRCLFTEWQVT